MTKNVLLAATAVSVMAFAGAASAHDLTFRAAGTAAAHIVLADATAPGVTYPLAAEAKTPSVAPNTFALGDRLTSGNLPSGNVLLTITLENAVFGTGIGAANVLADTSGGGCTTFTAAPSTGGGAGTNTATFVISNSAADCAGYYLDLPISVVAAGEVAVTTNLRTDGAQTPIDQATGPARKVIISRPNAFEMVVNGVTGTTGALGDTRATLDVSPAYTTFKLNGAYHTGATFGVGSVAEDAANAQLGTAALLVDLTAKYGLIRTDNVLLAHVTDADLVANGNFSAINAKLGGAASDSETGSVANFLNRQAALATPKAAPAPLAFSVVHATGAIPASTYSLDTTYVLDNTLYNQEATPNAALESIERDGTNVVFPWMNSSSVQTATGTSNIIRLGNVSSTQAGAVYVQVMNAVNSAPGYVAATAPVQIFPSIAANGERVINTATLTTALGEFGRGDVQVSVEARPETITARRYATLANGSVTEFQSGTVASDQNQVNVP